jgi:hypothetical protein
MQMRMSDIPYGVHWINPLSAFVSLTLHPMPVKIGEKTINVVRSGRVAIPFLGVITQKRLVLKGIRLLEEIARISDQE